MKKLLTLALLPLGLAACGGGGGDGGEPANRAPTANAGPDRTVFESVVVDLSGSGTDADGDTLTFSWTQTSGPTVSLSGADSANASFTAPDVSVGAPEDLVFRLDVSDGTATQSDNVTITVEENQPPVANAGVDQRVIQTTTVTLDGTASADPNVIDTLSFSWIQTAGVSVSLTSPDSAQPTFVAPDVAGGTTEVVEFELTVSDGVFSNTDAVAVTVEEGEPFVNVSGTVQYEFVPPNLISTFPYCRGLNFTAVEERPMRAVTIELVDSSSGSVIASTVSDGAGNYSFTDIQALTDVFIRIRAELKKVGSPSWDVEIRDNVDTSATPPPLEQRPLYVLQGSEFNTGGTDLQRNLTATTGWDTVSSSYTGPRAAAPFAILDAIYSGMQLILDVDGTATFTSLDAYWSENNTLVSGSTDIDAGELPASFYTSDPDRDFVRNPSLFLLGDADVDTEEFDEHVVVHEWGHYFEAALSRSDSTGGPHALGESLDARLAFGEGWATALAAMALDREIYCDTGAAGTTNGFGINAETSSFSEEGSRPGWYNEISVVTFLYDLFDTRDDGADTGSIGFRPIYETMVGPQVTTPAFTTVFSFATELRAMLDPVQASLLDDLLAAEQINPAGLDIWGSNASNDANASPSTDVLPLYIDLPTDGTVEQVCVTSQFDSGRDGNKLGENRFLRINVPSATSYRFLIQTQQPTDPPLPTDDPDDARDQSDPDVVAFRDGSFEFRGISGDANEEDFVTPNLAVDTYVAELSEFRFADDETAETFPDRICFDVSFTP